MDVHYGVMQFPRGAFRLPLAAACLAALALCSCASIQRAQDEGAVRQVVDFLNAGQSQRLAAMSASPFLLDGEIVALPADVASFWDGIVKAGFRVEGAALDTGTPVGPGSAGRFADTMEVRSFFERYVKQGARVLEMQTSAGARTLLLVRSEWFAWRILGFKGPF